jgi:hypothetical protein
VVVAAGHVKLAANMVLSEAAVEMGTAERRTYANNVDITDPHRNFTPDEWERLGSMRSYVLQLREGGRDGRGRSDRTQSNNSTNRTASSVTAANNNNNNTNDNNNGNNVSANNSVVSEITERGS